MSDYDLRRVTVREGRDVFVLVDDYVRRRRHYRRGIVRDEEDRVLPPSASSSRGAPPPPDGNDATAPRRERRFALQRGRRAPSTRGRRRREKDEDAPSPPPRKRGRAAAVRTAETEKETLVKEETSASTFPNSAKKEEEEKNAIVASEPEGNDDDDDDAVADVVAKETPVAATGEEPKGEERTVAVKKKEKEDKEVSTDVAETDRSLASDTTAVVASEAEVSHGESPEEEDATTTNTSGTATKEKAPHSPLSLPPPPPPSSTNTQSGETPTSKAIPQHASVDERDDRDRDDHDSNDSTAEGVRDVSAVATEPNPTLTPPRDDPPPSPAPASNVAEGHRQPSRNDVGLSRVEATTINAGDRSVVVPANDRAPKRTVFTAIEPSNLTTERIVPSPVRRDDLRPGETFAITNTPTAVHATQDTSPRNERVCAKVTTTTTTEPIIAPSRPFSTHPITMRPSPISTTRPIPLNTRPANAASPSLATTRKQSLPVVAQGKGAHATKARSNDGSRPTPPRVPSRVDPRRDVASDGAHKRTRTETTARSALLVVPAPASRRPRTTVPSYRRPLDENDARRESLEYHHVFGGERSSSKRDTELGHRAYLAGVRYGGRVGARGEGGSCRMTSTSDGAVVIVHVVSDEERKRRAQSTASTIALSRTVPSPPQPDKQAAPPHTHENDDSRWAPKYYVVPHMTHIVSEMKEITAKAVRTNQVAMTKTLAKLPRPPPPPSRRRETESRRPPVPPPTTARRPVVVDGTSCSDLPSLSALCEWDDLARPTEGIRYGEDDYDDEGEHLLMDRELEMACDWLDDASFSTPSSTRSTAAFDPDDDRPSCEVGVVEHSFTNDDEDFLDVESSSLLLSPDVLAMIDHDPRNEILAAECWS